MKPFFLSTAPGFVESLIINCPKAEPNNVILSFDCPAEKTRGGSIEKFQIRVMSNVSSNTPVAVSSYNSYSFLKL